MSRVEPTSRSDDKRQTEQRQPRDSANVGHTPSKAEGDERTVDEALRNQDEKRQS
jgi:hypothetical protein